MHHGLILPLFGGFADVASVADVAVAAEERGFDGLFVWDHVLSPVPGEWAIADPWVTLTAVAAATSRIVIGPMVTPIARRRLATLMRATYSLAQFSSGRLIVGLGLGGDKGRELSAFGEDDDRGARVAKLSEGANILQRLWAGETVNHRSEAWVLEDVKLVGGDEPRPDIPIWMASTNGALAPARRAAHYQGLYPIDVDLDGFKRIVETVYQERGSTEGFEFAVSAHPTTDPTPFVEAGATWLLHAFWPGNSPAQVLRFVARHEGT